MEASGTSPLKRTTLDAVGGLLEGSESMRIVRDQIEGDHVLEESLQLDGQVTGSLSVNSGVTLVLNGMVCGSLFLLPGSTADVNGTVVGDIQNTSAIARIRGTVNGSVVTADGQTIIEPDAVVRGVIVNRDLPEEGDEDGAI